MKKIVILVDPVSAGLNLIEAASVEHEFIAVYTIGEDRVKKYVPSLDSIESSALAIFHTDEAAEVLGMLDPKWKERIISVIPASEPGVELASDLANRLGLIHLDRKVAKVCRDKTQIRNALKSLGMASVAFQECTTVKESLAFVDQYQLPVVMKHPTGAGQNNIFICSTKREVERAFETIVSAPNIFGQTSDIVLVEEFLQGTEYAVNFIVANKEIRLLDTWEYEHYLFDEKNRLYDNITHFQRRSEGKIRAEKYAQSVIEALKIDNGYIHLEVIDDPVKGPVLVDIGARLIGGHFTTLIKQLGLGDPFKTTLKLYDGTLDVSAIKYNPKCGMSGVFIPIFKTGIVTEIKGIEAIQQRNGYGFHFCSIEVGDRVERSEELGNMAASFYISAPTDVALQEEIDFVRNTFELLVD